MSKTKKIIVWIFVIVAVVGAVGFYAKSKKPKTTYTTANAEKGSLIQTVSVTGKADPENQVDLSFRTTGELVQISEVGSNVLQGQELASLDRKSLSLQYKSSQADIDYQTKTLSAMKKKKDIYNKQQRQAQEALINKAVIAQNLTKQSIDDSVITSPVNGIVAKKYYETGETVTIGSPVVSIATNDLILQSNVPESDIVKVSIGQHADVTFDALSQDEIFDSEVVEIDPVSTVIQDVVYYKVKLKLNTDDERIKPGMSVNIDIKTAEKNNVVMTAIRAVKTDGNRKYVDILQDDNTTKQVDVETGLEGDGGMVEITKGLKGGEKVVTFVQTK